MDGLGAGVQTDRPAADRGAGDAGGAAQQGADPRQQFLVMKRLDHVVVGAGFQALDLFLPAAPGGEDQHREGPVQLPPFPDHVHAAPVGQADVHHRQVEGIFPAHEYGLAPVGGGIDGEAGVPQQLLQLLAQLGFVLDDQDAHREDPIRRRCI